MKYINLLFFCFLFFGCSKTDVLYWCGDHACRSVAEKNAYFKKTMIIEIKKSDQFDKITRSNLEIIKEQAGLEDKKRNVRRKTFVKKTEPNKKRIIKNEKKLAKQARINELKKIKNAKKLAKQARINELKKIKNAKKLTKKSRSIKKKKRVEAGKQYRKKSSSKKYASIKNNKASTEFKNLVNKIIKRNAHKPYPNINDVPN